MIDEFNYLNKESVFSDSNKIAGVQDFLENRRIAIQLSFMAATANPCVIQFIINVDTTFFLINRGCLATSLVQHFKILSKYRDIFSLISHH